MQTTTNLFQRAQTTTLALVALALVAAIPARAATLYWDGNGSGTSGIGGSGNWTNDSGDTDNWANSTYTIYQAWVDQNNAVLAGTTGTVTLTSNITVGNGSVGDILRFNTSDYTVDAAPGFSLTIKAPTSGRYEAVYGRNTTIDAPIILDAGGNDVVFRNEAGIVTINGNISGNGKFWPWQQSNIASQKTILNGNNSFTGGVSGYNWGTLVVGSDTALGTGPLNWGGNRLEAGPANPTVANAVSFGNDGNTPFHGTNSLTFSSAQVYYSTGSTPTTCSRINVVDAGGLLTFASLTEHSHYTTGGFTKLGNGTLVISGQYGSGGVTTVSAGTLILNGATGNKNGTGGYDPMPGYVVATGASLGGSGIINLASGQAVTVQSGGTLRGTLTINGAVAIQSGGALKPGSSIGTLNTGALTLAGAYEVELGTHGLTPAAGLSDRTVVAGNVALTGSTLQLVDNADANGQGSAGAGRYRLIDYTGSRTDGFASVVNSTAKLAKVVYNEAETAVDLELWDHGVASLSEGSTATSLTPITSLTVDLGQRTRNSGTYSLGFSVDNLLQTDGLTAGLDMSFLLDSPDEAALWTDLAGLTNLAGGDSGAFLAFLDSALPLGSYSETYQLTLTDNTTGFYGTANPSQILTLTLTGAIIPEPASAALLGLAGLAALRRRR